jgi:hypothetical protein
MMSLDYLDQLEAYLLIFPSLTDEMVTELSGMVQQHDIKLVVRAAECLMSSKGHSGIVIDLIPTLSLTSQKALCVLVASSDKSPAFVMLLNLLKSTANDELADLIVICLSKAQYPIFPLIIDALYDTTLRDRDRLARAVQQMHPKNVLPYLAMFPVIPYEGFFRDALGDDVIDGIYHK